MHATTNANVVDVGCLEDPLGTARSSCASMRMQVPAGNGDSIVVDVYVLNPCACAYALSVVESPVQSAFR